MSSECLIVTVTNYGIFGTFKRNTGLLQRQENVPRQLIVCYPIKYVIEKVCENGGS